MDIKELMQNEYHSLVINDIRTLDSAKYTVTMPAASKLMLEEIASLFGKPLSRMSGDILHDITQEMFHYLDINDKKRLSAIVEEKTRQYLVKTAKDNGGSYTFSGDVTPFPYYAKIAEEKESEK